MLMYDCEILYSVIYWTDVFKCNLLILVGLSYFGRIKRMVKRDGEYAIKNGCMNLARFLSQFPILVPVLDSN